MLGTLAVGARSSGSSEFYSAPVIPVTLKHPNEAHCIRQRQRAVPLRDFLARMRHDGCGGRAAKAELLTGVEGVNSRPVRKIVLRAD